MGRCEYICNYYKVPADIGRRVTVSGKPGIIAKARERGETEMNNYLLFRPIKHGELIEIEVTDE